MILALTVLAQKLYHTCLARSKYVSGFIVFIRSTQLRRILSKRFRILKNIPGNITIDVLHRGVFRTLSNM